MHLRKKNLNLIWRIVGGNILLLIEGVALISVNVDMAEYMIYINCITILFLTHQIIKNDLTLESKYFEVLIIYFVVKFVINSIIANTEEKCILTTLAILIESLWIYKWYMLPKKYNE